MEALGLTSYLIAMMRAPVDKLAGADVSKLAGKYGIGEDVARWYLAMWLRRS